MDGAIERMGAYMAARGVALRPHAKTHKSLEVGRRQLAAGAAGLTVGTLGEAEVFAEGGLDDLFIAYPLIAHGPKAARIAALTARVGRLRVGVDSEAGARALAAALGANVGRRRSWWRSISGGRRGGVAPSVASSLAASAAELGLDVIGVFTHGGHGYAGQAATVDAADDEVRALTEAAASLSAHGLDARVVSAGSTPTATGSARGAVTEERPGTYVFGDRQQAALGAVGPDAIAAGIAATVVSVAAATTNSSWTPGPRSWARTWRPTWLATARSRSWVARWSHGVRLSRRGRSGRRSAAPRGRAGRGGPAEPHLPGRVGDAAKKTKGQLRVTKFELTDFQNANVPSGAAGTAPPPGGLKLTGIALDNPSVPELLESLQHSGIFSRVELLKLKEREDKDTSLRDFEVRCEF